MNEMYTSRRHNVSTFFFKSKRIKENFSTFVQSHCLNLKFLYLQTYVLCIMYISNLNIKIYHEILDRSYQTMSMELSFKHYRPLLKLLLSKFYKDNLLEGF